MQILHAMYSIAGGEYYKIMHTRSLVKQIAVLGSKTNPDTAEIPPKYQNNCRIILHFKKFKTKSMEDGAAGALRCVLEVSGLA